MTKTVDEFTAKRITYETPVLVSTVVERLDKELSKETGGLAAFRVLATASSKEGIEKEINKITGGKDFALFSVLSHHPWLNGWFGRKDTPQTYLYTLGNPLVAQTMLQYDLYTGLHVPPRLLVLEKADRSGTQIIYILPSSLIAVPVGGEVNEQLKTAAEALDAKLENLVVRVSAV
ncbi:hypothetical protein BKA93DRAFT_808970 [Sparassis latifolia]